MERERFPVEQIAAVLKQAEARVPVDELIRKVGISEQRRYRCMRVREIVKARVRYGYRKILAPLRREAGKSGNLRYVLKPI